MCFQSFVLMTLFFFNINNYKNLSGKAEKISKHGVGSASPSCFGTGHVTVLSIPHWKTEYSGVRQHRFYSALEYCSVCFGVEGVKGYSLIKSAQVDRIIGV